MSRRIICIAVLCLIAAMLFCACKEGGGSSAVADGSMTPATDSSGNITGYERYSHNADGLLSRVDYFTTDETLDHYVLYDYDSDGRLIMETTYAGNGIGLYYYDYEYDVDGNYSRVMYVTQTEGYTVTFYENGEESELFSYDNKGNLLSHQEKQNGQWVETPYEETENTTETTA